MHFHILFGSDPERPGVLDNQSLKVSVSTDLAFVFYNCGDSPLYPCSGPSDPKMSVQGCTSRRIFVHVVTLYILEHRLESPDQRSNSKQKFFDIPCFNILPIAETIDSESTENGQSITELKVFQSSTRPNGSPLSGTQETCVANSKR